MSATEPSPEQRVARELLETATRLTHLANELLGGETLRRRALTAVPQGDEEMPSDRSVGVHGAVTEDIALLRARELQEFTTGEFAITLGLAHHAAMRWLSVLRRRKPAVLEQIAPTRYRCLQKAVLTVRVMEWVEKQPKPFSETALRRDCQLEGWETREVLRALMVSGKLREVEIDGYPMFDPRPPAARGIEEVEVQRGAPVDHVGRGPGRLERSQRKHQLKQRKQRYERMQEAKQRRADAQKEKAKQQPTSK